ncbi:FkbM family methyltransferase [Hasllibacter halocynthiae]|uniref:FkbM family methyltransferase n=1 Tax=Hasllibacter halocynthiae TaxID=595589 RepID=A0A2T0X480_9RHOB|nr:FkbM family methyltransferase [Hasllibacter halocynthiae]PRY93751.1 FkbM family methyltransferase [Hasllibacter halocynthiae]
MTDLDDPIRTVHGLVVPRSRFLNDRRAERIAAGRYEGQEIAGALALVREGDRVLELGAGIGVVGATVALARGPSAVLSFEANPALIPSIEALHAANGLTNVELRHAVLDASPDRPATRPFAVHASYLGSSLGGAGRRVDVPTAGWDDVVGALRPDVLICDIEGGEAELLGRVDLSGIRAAVVEFHPGAYGVAGMRACKRALREAGLEPVKDLSTRTVWAAERG